MANFVSYIGKVLPDDIKAKIDELAEKEDSPLSKVIYETMKRNQVYPDFFIIYGMMQKNLFLHMELL